VSPYPGSWIVALQASHKVARVCTWDRPGYGFSDTGPVELGMVAESLHLALEKSGEKGPFIVVGDGYGGLVSRVFAAAYPDKVHSLLYVDSQSAQTWFRFPPEYNMLTLRVHRFFTHLLPTLISPLGIKRFYSLFTQYDPSMSRVLASKRPSPSTAELSTPLRSRLTAEVYESHTHHSQSYKALLGAQPPRYPSDKPAIILSSDLQMQRNKAWAEGQRALAEEITSEEGREAWVVIKGGVGHDLCSPTGGKDGRGRRACSRALIHLFSIE
jgi:pimeloyl-ACP methyl ester carboxylesterase